MSSRRPYVICHMAPSIDGRIVTERWKASPKIFSEYERTAQTFDADAWMIGRISMEPYAGKAALPRRKVAPIPRTDFIASPDAESYAIALDPSGKLRWRSRSIDGEPVIAVLTERVSDEYLAFLRGKGVSYLFGGRSQVDLKRVLEKLRSEFGIETLLLEGGGGINGSFLKADLIDEFSVLLVPVADGGGGIPTLFDAPGTSSTRRLKLKSVEKRAADVVWIRYSRAR
jgi:2,5-diamino-6-(ribosylamino)-4(3H)-pyrimidinone 5'-phosphate reductase